MESTRAKQLASTFKIAAAQAAALDHNMSAAEANHNYVKKVLEDANELLGMYGVLKLSGDWHGTRYGNVVAFYLDAGDPNVTTIFYDAVAGKFRIIKWSDFVDTWGAKYGWDK